MAKSPLFLASRSPSLPFGGDSLTPTLADAVHSDASGVTSAQESMPQSLYARVRANTRDACATASAHTPWPLPRSAWVRAAA